MNNYVDETTFVLNIFVGTQQTPILAFMPDKLFSALEKESQLE